MAADRIPWRTVGGNVDLALKYAKVPRDRRAERRNQLLHRVGLDGTADRKIWEISGGQQQRVAIARALAADELRRSPEHTRLRAEVGRAVRAAAA